MIMSKFNPGLQVLDAIRRNHPASLAQTLGTLVRHLTGCPNLLPPEAIMKECNAFLHDDRRARSDSLRLRLFGKTEIVIDAKEWGLRLIDGTPDQRFLELWFALTGTDAEHPKEGGAGGETHADIDSAD